MDALKRPLALLLTLTASAALADDADIAKGLQNLRRVHDVATLVTIRHGMAPTTEPAWTTDPWGNPYRIEESASGYRIVGAGSDGTFEDPLPKGVHQFAGLEGDVVFEDGMLVRSNRNWLHARVDPKGDSANALTELRRAEMQFALMHDPAMRVLTEMRVTAMTMQLAAELVKQGKEVPQAISRDVWGTPLRIVSEGGTVRVISAGTDHQFDPSSWWLSPRPDAAEDMVLENGALTRHVDDRQFLRDANLKVTAIPQPPDVSLANSGNWSMIDPSITAPVVVERIEPKYSEDYRRLGISGIVILQAAISASGAVEDVRVLKSLAPDLDMNAADALRQWKFKAALRDGKPIPVLFNLTINFTLK